MIPIPIPKEMVNDDAYLVVALLAEPGERVAAGQPLAELESSKAAFSIFSPGDGYFRPDYFAGQMAPVGENFGIIAETPQAEAEPQAAKEDIESKSTGERDLRFSLPAWELLKTNDLSADRFAGMTHVRRSDVEAVLAKSGKGGFDLSALDSLLDYDKRNSLVMLGGGGHCRECVEVVELTADYTIAGIIDTKAEPGTHVAEYPVIGGNDVLEKLRSFGIVNLVLAYGISGDHPARGRHFEELLSLGHRFPAIVHPKAAVNRHAVLGRGVQVMAGAMVGSEVRVGDACIINSNCVVSHDCDLSPNVHVAPGAILAGGVKIGRDTVIGMGATVYMRVRIGEGVVIYNGAHVFADVPDGMTIRGEWTGA